MAAWQFDLALITHNPELTRADGSRTAVITNEISRDLESRRLGRESMMALFDTLPTEKTWHSDLEIRGSIDGNRIDVLWVNSFVKELAIRLDLRDLQVAFLSHVLEFARSYDLLVLNPLSGAVLFPDLDLLLKDIVQSPAFRFVLNPEGFLRGILESKSKLH